MSISVIICSHNPKRAFFEHVLASLQQQTVPYDQWELLIIDNASDTPIQKEYNTSWHPNVRFATEPQLGVTYARARGILEAQGNWLIMVDDDAPLFPDYIQCALNIIQQHPHVACFGGNQLPYTDVKPPRHYHAYLEMIGYRVVHRDRISNMYMWETTPAGAGMVVKRSIAQLYANAVFNKKQHAALGRKGNSLMSSQDIDLAYNSIDQGFFNGVFASLKVYHLHIEEHLNDEYLWRRRYHNVISSNTLNYIRFGKKPKRIPRSRYWTSQLLRLFRGQSFQFKMSKLEYQASEHVRKQIQQGQLTR